MAEGPQFSVVPLSVLLDRELSDPAKLFAGYIGGFMNHRGTCYPGLDRLADLAGCSMRTAQRRMQELADRGHLVVKRQPRRNAVLAWAAPMSGYAFFRSGTMTGQVGGTSSDGMTGQTTGDDVTKNGDDTPNGGRSSNATFGSERHNDPQQLSENESGKASLNLPPRLPGESTPDYFARTIPGFGRRS